MGCGWRAGEVGEVEGGDDDRGGMDRPVCCTKKCWSGEDGSRGRL